MKGTLFKKLVAGALALLMVGTALPQGSDLTGIFGGHCESSIAYGDLYIEPEAESDSTE